MFRHYILCRYNTSLYSGNKHHIIDPEVWMVARLPLFERLLRSLATQTNIDYCLLVALDPLTPIQHRDLIEASLDKSGVPARIVVSSGRRVGYRSPLQDWLRDREPEAEYLITSRIDNDDEYLPTFVQTIQDEFSPGVEVLDVPGVQCDGHAYYTSERVAPNSPFLSLVEPWNDVKTAVFDQHPKMSQLFSARFVGSGYLYVQHVHESNLLNKIRGKKLATDEINGLPALD